MLDPAFQASTGRRADKLGAATPDAAGIESLRILVVEDNVYMRSIVVTVLNGLGIRLIKEVDSGESALQALDHWKPDIVFLDLLMAGMGGLDFARSVRNRRDSPNPEVPIVVVSANSEVSRVAEARDAGVNEFLAKPIRASEVWRRLVSVIYSTRPFIRTDLYYGPDRRRRAKPGFSGPFRRRSDNREVAPDAFEIP